MNLNSKRALLVTLAACSGIHAAQAQTAEVVHWWTSKGESAAVQELAAGYRKAGGVWVDNAIAGGENARNTIINRIAGGKPPTVAQFNPTTQFRELMEEGLLNDIDAVAVKQGWDKMLPVPLQRFAKSGGKYYAMPVGVHNPSWFWYSKEVLAKAGVTKEPANIDEFFAALDKVKKAGFVPLALGGQTWQEFLLFFTVLHTSGGSDLYKRVFASTDGKVATSPEMKKVLSDFKRLKNYVDAGSPNRDWNLAAAMLISNRAGFQVMGDWVKGEFNAANKVAGKDYGCFPGFGPKAPYLVEGDVFVFPRTKDPQAIKAQQLFALTSTSSAVQVAFNLKKGSLPIRTDVDLSKADVCTQIGMAVMKDPSRLLQSPEQIVSPDKAAQISDVITKFWNSSQSVDDAAKALAGALRS